MKKFLWSILLICAFCFVLPVQASDPDEKQLTAYPNPVNRGAMFKVDLPSSAEGELIVVLYNTVGKVIYTLKTGNRTVEFNAPDVSGIYLLRVVEKQKVIAVEKIIVKE